MQKVRMGTIRIRTIRNHLASIIAVMSILGCGSNTTEQSTISTPSPDQLVPGTKIGVLALEDSVEPENDENASPISFSDVTQQSGIDFTYYGVPSPQAYMTEQNGGGVAVFDADGDQVQDIFLVNGSHFQKPAESGEQSSQLYRGRGKFSYDKVTRSAFIEHHSFGMGVASGDFDNDGFADLFIACFGRNSLFQNQGDGTFRRITSEPIDVRRDWSCSPAFADFNGDGLLDLYVVNYVDWASDHKPCSDPKHPEIRRTCSPTSKNAVADNLYLNNGNLTFADVGKSAGIANEIIGKGLALGVFDANGDGRLDIYVANDTTANSLFINQDSMKFVDAATEYGVAVSVDGVHGASMGVGIADYDRNGNKDILVTNFRNQVNDLYSSLGAAGYVFANTETGLDLSSRSKLAFGAVFRDLNGDTWPDIFISNGHIWNLTSLGNQYEYQMTASLLANQSGSRFRDVSEKSGKYFQKKWLGRSVAAGDLDNDGDIDLVVQHLESRARVLRNDTVDYPQSVTIGFSGVKSSRSPLGCQVRFSHPTGIVTTHIPSGESFQASHDPRINIPIGAGNVIKMLEITWPDGHPEQWLNIGVTAGQQLLAIEGGQISSLAVENFQ